LTDGAAKNNLHVTALNPGTEKLKVELATGDGGGFTIDVTGPDTTRTLMLDKALNLRD